MEAGTDTAAPTEASSAISVVEGFVDALERLDVEGAREYMAPDIEYRNVPFPAVRGPEATIKTLKSFLVLARGFEVEMLNIAADGDVVLTERIDTFTNGPFRAGFWVCGTFEVRDGKITVWRDRFDFADMTVGILKGLVMIPFRAAAGSR